MKIKNENIQSYKVTQKGYLLIENKSIINISFLVDYFETLQEAYDCKFVVYFSKRNDEIVLIVEKSLYNKRLEETIIYWREWWNYNLTILNTSLSKFKDKNINEIFENEYLLSEEDFVPYSKKFEEILNEYDLNFDKKNQKYFLTEIIPTDETNISPILEENILDSIIIKI